MGGLVADEYVGGLFNQLNLRFAPGAAIMEMIALQAEFRVFSPEHSLEASFALLNIGPLENWSTRRGWYKFLNGLQGKPSDQPKVSGHDRIIAALADNLATRDAVPVLFVSHATTKDDRVKVSKPMQSLSYSSTEYLTISFPLTRIEKDRMKRRGKK
jgi:hypothetical protein